MSKSFVTLAICPICHQETGELLMDTRLAYNSKTGRRELRDTFEKHTVTPKPCEKCRDLYLKEGVLILNPENGNLVVLKDQAYNVFFSLTPIPTGRVVFAEQIVLDRLNEIYSHVE